MITVTATYPNTDGGKFDLDYYMQNHIKTVSSLIGTELLGMTVEQGLAGVAPGSPAPYFLIARLKFASLESFQSFFAAHGGALMADIPNFTNIQPVIQISQVLVPA